MKVKSESEVAQCTQLLGTPWTAAYQAPPSVGFSRQEYWSGVPLPSLKEYCTITNKLAFAIHSHMDETNTHKIDQNKTVKNENM